MSSLSYNLHCWEPSGELFALVSGGNRIQIFKTASGDLVQELVLPFQLTTVYSSICWSPKLVQRKSKKQKLKNKGKSIIVCGTENGKIIVWDVDRNEVIREITCGTNNKVDVDFLNSTTLLIASPKTFLATCLYAQGEETIRTIQIGNENITSIASNKGMYFVVGTSGQPLLYDSSSKEKITTLEGHPIGRTIYSFLNDHYLIIASEDQYMNLYNLEMTKGKVLRPIIVLSIEDHPKVVDLKESGEFLDILAVTEGGKCFVWRISKNEKKAIKPQTTITRKDGVVMSAKFSDLEGQIITVSGTALQPLFEVVKYVHDDKMIEKIKLTKQVKNIIKGDKKRKRDDQRDTRHDGSVVLGPLNMELPGAKYVQAFGKVLPNKETRKLLEDKVRDLDIVMNKSDDDEESIPGVSLAQSLIAALKFNDQTDLDKCLKQSDLDIIQRTVKQLPAQTAILLLEAILDRYQNQSVNASSLVHWLRSVLVTHTSHIMSQPDIINKLSPLYHSIDARLNVFPNLLDLSGRLDLLLSLAGYKQVNLSSEDDDFEEVEQDDEIPVDREEELIEDEEEKVITVKDKGEIDEENLNFNNEIEMGDDESSESDDE